MCLMQTGEERSQTKEHLFGGECGCTSKIWKEGQEKLEELLGKKVEVETRKRIMNRIIFEESRVGTTNDRLEKHRKAPTLVGIWDNKLMLDIRQELVKEGWGEDEAMEMTKENWQM